MPKLAKPTRKTYARRADSEAQIDEAIGLRIRAARALKRMSQADLGAALPNPLTFQQIQKNERGVNRVAVSRLVSIAHVTGQPISFFLDDIDLPVDPAPQATAAAITLARRVAALPEAMQKMVRSSVEQFEALAGAPNMRLAGE